MTDHIENSDLFAAIDLGSNSFHMIIARVTGGRFQVVDRLREMVQLRAGIDAEGNLNEVAQARALACLARFGERTANLSAGHVRAVGTNTLRIARNAREFMAQARVALGHPIEIVAGEEEARLIYVGVARALSFDAQRRLVMDIGGGSTEFIIGEGKNGLRRESLSMGCVSFTQRFFADGGITKARLTAATIAARLQLRDIRHEYRNLGWSQAIGASGTIRSVAKIVAANDWCEDGIITTAALDRLYKEISNLAHVEALDLAGLSEERAGILPAGVSILRASFHALKIDQMTVSDGALREGLLQDLVGRQHDNDARTSTVTAMMQRYHVDTAQVARVHTLAMRFFKRTAAAWELDPVIDKQRLTWAVQLHEIGLAISHGGRQKHAAYLVEHSAMSGFSREEQHALSTIILGQRRQFPKKAIKALPDEIQASTRWLIIILRLALVFNRGRSKSEHADLRLKGLEKGAKITFTADWLEAHPLTEQDLLQEQIYLAQVKLKLKLKTAE